jgi:hypothetical protein
VSELSAGDEKVKQTLDQLIDSHHDKGHAFAEGSGASAGDSKDGDELGFKTVNKAGVVTLLPPDTGQAADYPVLMSQPGSSIIRLRPNQPREIGIKSIPSGHWAAIAQFNAESDPGVLELNVKKEKLDDHGKLTLTFTESEGFDTDQYPAAMPSPSPCPSWAWEEAQRRGSRWCPSPRRERHRRGGALSLRPCVKPIQLSLRQHGGFDPGDEFSEGADVDSDRVPAKRQCFY